MDGAGIPGREVRLRRRHVELTVQRVASLQDHLFPGIGLDDSRNIGMPAVVSGVRLFPQWLAAIDFDDFHRGSCR